jgi:hypothetical protein
MLEKAQGEPWMGAAGTSFVPFALLPYRPLTLRCLGSTIAQGQGNSCLHSLKHRVAFQYFQGPLGIGRVNSSEACGGGRAKGQPLLLGLLSQAQGGASALTLLLGMQARFSLATSTCGPPLCDTTSAFGNCKQLFPSPSADGGFANCTRGALDGLGLLPLLA